MTRARSPLVRVIVLALVLLTVGGGAASAESGAHPDGGAAPTSLPDDPGYGD